MVEGVFGGFEWPCLTRFFADGISVDSNLGETAEESLGATPENEGVASFCSQKSLGMVKHSRFSELPTRDYVGSDLGYC